jgi:hypothetical protein
MQNGNKDIHISSDQTTKILGCVKDDFGFFMTIISSEVGIHFGQPTNMRTSILEANGQLMMPSKMSTQQYLL